MMFHVVFWDDWYCEIGQKCSGGVEIANSQVGYSSRQSTIQSEMRHRTSYDQHFQPQVANNVDIGKAANNPTRRPKKRKKGPRIELNHGIIATAGCCFFLGCVVSTIVLLCFLRRPHDVHSPFWQRKVDLAQHLKRQQQHHQQEHNGLANKRTDEKCPSYGCPIYPVEMSNLNTNSSKDSLIVSKSHITLAIESLKSIKIEL